MADTILKEVISGNVIWGDFVSWLKSKKGTQQENPFKDSCKINQGDFVIYFVNLLHDEVSSILQKSSGGNCSVKQSTILSVLEKKKYLYSGRNECLSTSPNDQSAGLLKQAIGQSANGDFGKSSAINCKSKQDSNILNKSLESNNKNYIRCYGVMNGTVKSNIDSQNNSSKVRHNTLISPAQKSCEGTFLNSCHLSPIVTDLCSSRKEKPSGLGSEIDSPHNRIVRKDRSGFSNRVTNERSTSSPCSATFNLAEHMFPVVGSPAKQNASRRRRIKPTRLADSFEKGKVVDQNRAPNFGEVVRPLEPSVPFREDAALKERKGSPEADFRDLLRLEKLKLQQNSCSSIVTLKNPRPVTIVPASPELVKFRDELCVLANIYNLLLDTNIICNIVSEINFIISLLNVQEESETNCFGSNETASLGYFVTVHECVFFATKVLNQQRFFLNILDKASLKLLLNNKRVSTFVPDLWKYLSDLHQTRSDARLATGSAFHTSVCFQSDTDNRENFPNDKTFVTFRKQRDAFYEILGLWEENHSLPGWSFGVALGPRVRTLLCMNDEPANFIHFARLFRTQLLGSCWKSSNSAVEEESNGALAEVLKCLKEGNPDKYSRLHERLVTPVKSSNSCTVTDFPDQQEFYKDFIVYGCHAVFNTHLIDSFWYEIVLLNSSNFSASEVEEDTTVDKDTKEEFISCVRNLQLLAKFLGFVLFLPYRSNSKIPDHLVEKQISLRRKSKPRIDLLDCVQEATQSKKLTLTIPWVTQFLSMLDGVSYNLPYYREVICLLFAIYQMLPSSLLLTPYGSLMLKVCLGWLFEKPQLPEDLYYIWSLNGNQNYGFIVNVKKSRSMTAGIDELELIDWDTIQILCPHLETIKWLLLSDTNSVRNVLPPRHITPVLVAPEQTISSSSTQNIEIELEENFLEGQPPSLRKTIEFVSERIASSCVKYICSKPLLEVKEKSLKMLEVSFESDAKESSLTKVPLETLLSRELKKNCLAIIPKLCYDKCGSIIPSLLAEDVSEEVTRVCVKIAVRLSMEKVNVWINSHITPALFSKHLSSEIDKVCRNAGKPLKVSHVLPCGWRDTCEDDAVPPAESLIMIRKLICKIIEDPEVKDEEIIPVLNTVLRTLQSRKDLIPSAERVLGALSVDLAFILLAHQPELMQEKMLYKFLSVWTTKEVSSSQCFLHMICPRNIMILNNSPHAEKTWSATAHFLCFVLKNNIVSPNEFESQCVAVFRQEWPMVNFSDESLIQVMVEKS